MASVTPSARSSSSSPSVAPTISSKRTPQQQVIHGYDGFNNLVASIWARAEKVDMAKAHQVAKDPFVTKYLRGVATGLSAGFVQTGKLISTVSSVTTAGDTIKTCLDQSHMKLTDLANPSGPRAPIPKPSPVTVSLMRSVARGWSLASRTVRAHASVVERILVVLLMVPGVGPRGLGGAPAYKATGVATWSVRFEQDGRPVTIPGAPTELTGPELTTAVQVAEVQTVVISTR